MVATRLESVRVVDRAVEGARASEPVLPDRPETSRKVRVDSERAILHGRRLQGQALGRAIGAAARAVKARARRIAAAWRRSRDEGYAIDELRRLDDRMLRDIGIAHRSQIVSAVQALAGQAPQTPRTSEPRPVVALERPARESETETTRAA